MVELDSTRLLISGGAMLSDQEAKTVNAEFECPKYFYDTLIFGCGYPSGDECFENHLYSAEDGLIEVPPTDDYPAGETQPAAKQLVPLLTTCQCYSCDIRLLIDKHDKIGQTILRLWQEEIGNAI